MALPRTLWAITVYNRAVLDRMQFQMIFFLKAMEAIAWNLESIRIFYIVWQCNDIYNRIRKKYIYGHSLRIWLAKQEKLIPSGRLVFILVLLRNQGSLNVNHSSLLLRHGVDVLVFMWYSHNVFFHIFQRIALNWIHSFANRRNLWHATIIWPIRSVTQTNKYILYSHWNWFY